MEIIIVIIIIIITIHQLATRLEKRAVVFAHFLLDSSSEPVDDLLVGVPAVLGRHEATRAAHAVCNTIHLSSVQFPIQLIGI